MVKKGLNYGMVLTYSQPFSYLCFEIYLALEKMLF